MIVRRSPAIVLSLVLGAAGLSGAPALATDGGTAKDGPVVKDCSGRSSVRVNVRQADGNQNRFDVIGAVFSDDDDTWDWRMKHNGDISAQGSVVARDDIDRSFRVTRTMLDFYGSDDIVFRAENRRTSEICRVVTDY